MGWIGLFQITETVKHIGWKGPLEVFWSNTLLKAGLPQYMIKKEFSY